MFLTDIRATESHPAGATAPGFPCLEGAMLNDTQAIEADLYAQRLKAVSFFTSAKLANQTIQFGNAKDQWVEYKNNAITLYFTAPFAKPVLSEAQGLTFSVSDPSYYIAFSLAEKPDAVRFSSGTPSICKARIADAEPPQPTGLQESFSSFNAFGLSPPKTVLVECKAP